MLTLLGTTRFRQSEGNPNEYYEQAYDLAIQWDDTDALAFILSHRAYYAAQKVPPDYVSCRRFADESVRLAERVGNHEVCFRSLLNRASAERDLGLFESALASDQEAYQMALTRCNRVWEGGSTHGIGEDYHAMGHREQAQDYFNRALRVYRQNEEINELRRLIEFMRQHGYDVPGDIEEDEPDETRH
jgi:tetratricopeptide (TPR) repeat protein